MSDIKQAIQELRPCPFCGGEAEVVTTGVGCTNRDCAAFCANVPVAAWNTRSSVEGGTAGFTSRIEAAAEEIADNIRHTDDAGWWIAGTGEPGSPKHIAAIIRKHVEGKEA